MERASARLISLDCQWFSLPYHHEMKLRGTSLIVLQEWLVDHCKFSVPLLSYRLILSPFLSFWKVMLKVAFRVSSLSKPEFLGLPACH